MAQQKEDAGKAQSEVERLLEILKETENEKNDKEKKLHELERWEAGMERWCGLIISSSLRLNSLVLTNPSFRANPLVLSLFPSFLLPFWLHHLHLHICVWTNTHVIHVIIYLRECVLVFSCVCNHQIPETPLPLICGVLNRPENRSLPLLALSSQWEGWCGTTWAREWLVALSVTLTDVMPTLLVWRANAKKASSTMWMRFKLLRVWHFYRYL